MSNCGVYVSGCIDTRPELSVANHSAYILLENSYDFNDIKLTATLVDGESPIYNALVKDVDVVPKGRIIHNIFIAFPETTNNVVGSRARIDDRY